MRITRRTGGGRGDYEISENAGQITPRDLIDHRVTLHLGQGIVIVTGAVLRYRNGKFRLRAEGSQLHVPRQVAAALLMPYPVRANAPLRSGVPVMRRNAYTIQHINFSPNVVLQNGVAEVTVESIIVKNTDREENLIVTDRMREIALVWSNQEDFLDRIRELLQEHETLVRGGGPLPLRAEQIVKDLEECLSDPLSDIEVEYISGTDVLHALIESLDGAERVVLIPLADIDPTNIELKKREVKKWKRWANSRGARSWRFRRMVVNAYRARCMVCGCCFPSTSQNRVPGVDAAHILPWVQYDLDHVQNGLCLCKTHHWAFDEGLIRIEVSAGVYRIVIPHEVRERIRAEAPNFDLDALIRYTGPIPGYNLPANPSERPRPQFLERLISES